MRESAPVKCFRGPKEDPSAETGKGEYRMKDQTGEERLVVRLEGRIDSGNAEEWMERILEEMERHPGVRPEFDADGLLVISSAGLRMLLSLQKKQEEKLVIRNVRPAVYHTFETTGFTKLMDITEKQRFVSVENCPVIGQGAYGTVYRLDEDTVIKVCPREEDLPILESEQRKAREAFLMGIPTAIPFDIVRTEKGFGSVYEMVKAGSGSEILAAHPERLEEITEMYAAFLKTLHAAEDADGVFPDQREIYLGYLDALAGLLPEGTRTRMKKLLEAMPPDRHMVHGDAHLKNVMLSGNDMMLIDMETLSTGDPVFEFAALFMVYIAFGEDDPEDSLRFMGLEKEQCGALFEGTLNRYLDFPDEAEMRLVLDRAAAAGYLRFMYVTAVLRMGAEHLRDRRIQRSVRCLGELLGRVGSLPLRAAGERTGDEN